MLDNFRINVPYARAPLEPSDNGNGEDTCHLGVAVDIGTTTVVVLLVDLSNGEIVARASDFNRQMHLGDDVLTRINLCMIDVANLRRLRSAVVEETLGPLIRQALKLAGARATELAGVVVSGNTTMLHLLAGEDPSPMGVVPFTPRFVEHRRFMARALDLKLDRDHTLPVHLLPSAAAYIGADVVGGVVASNLLYDPGPLLLIDVGTNGEIILQNDGQLFGCSTAAGPAFEGAGLSHGLRAGRGAIDRVEIEGEPFTLRHHVIGGVPPVGLCGTAYLDFLAQARAGGLLTPAGRFAQTLSPQAAARISSAPGYGRMFRVTSDVSITEADIAQLLQAKAAIAAGILTLLGQTQLLAADIQRVYLAGGFGMSLNLDNAISVGLLPGFKPEQIELVGNTSLAGAYLALMDHSFLNELSDIGRRIKTIELNQTPEFEDRYLDMMSLT
ncbi:MAG: ASKHA domain-containing protein [Planctomycetota bacterium]